VDDKDHESIAQLLVRSSVINTTNLFLQERVEHLKKLDDGTFEATTETGRQIVNEGCHRYWFQRHLPGHPWLRDCRGNSIYHCLFCHGYEERGSVNTGVLPVDDMANPVICTAYLEWCNGWR